MTARVLLGTALLILCFNPTSSAQEAAQRFFDAVREGDTPRGVF